MQIIKSLGILILFVLPIFANAQSTYLTQGVKDAHFVERLEIKQQTNTHLNFSTLRPFNRKSIVREIEFLDSARMGYPDSTGRDAYWEWTDLGLTEVDEYNLQRFLMNNRDWSVKPKDSFVSRKPLFKNFYKTPSNFFEVDAKDFFVTVNPIIQFQQGVESNGKEPIFLNSRGVMTRGMIAKKLAFRLL